MSRYDGGYDIRRIFEEIELDLIASMKRTFARHIKEQEKEGFEWEQWQRATLRGLRAYRRENERIITARQKEIDQTVNDSILSRFQAGIARFTSAIKGIGTALTPGKRFSLPEHRAPQETTFFHANDQKLDALQQSTTQDIKKAEHAVLRQMDDVYRKVIFRSEMHMSAGAKTLEQAVDMATKEFLLSGINCIEYSNGRRVNIASYAEMALRTASHRAGLMGEGKKRDEWGIRTVVVSAHANTCPLCEPWQGKALIDDVFSNGTKAESEQTGYPLLSDAISAGLLHPNCRHSIATYFPGITQLPTVPDGKEATAKYQAEQKQRDFERKIRKWKRIAAGSQDEEKAAEAEATVKAYQRQLREHLKQHPYLRRNYNREKPAA